ncbi:MAG: hypothetical protein J5I94_03845 [Phaeodactylibacter sp.]|nr:hypothetical protein [Phaeodactylibacter sp.]
MKFTPIELSLIIRICEDENARNDARAKKAIADGDEVGVGTWQHRREELAGIIGRMRAQLEAQLEVIYSTSKINKPCQQRKR